MKSSGTVKKILFGAFVAFVGSLIVSGLAGLLVQKEMMPISASAVATAVIAFASVLVACFAAVRKMTKGKLTVTLVIAAIFIVLQLLIGGMLFPITEISMSWKIVLPVVAAAVSGVWSSAGRRHRR